MGSQAGERDQDCRRLEISWAGIQQLRRGRAEFSSEGGEPAIAPNAPAAAAVLGSPIIATGNQFQFTVTGTAGSNYVIQASIDLTASNWVSVFTHASQFPFTDTNVNTTDRRFFRAIVP